MTGIDALGPLYLWDFHCLFYDLLDFLEFSESNIEWQRRSHIHRLDRQYRGKDHPADEYFAERDNIEGRFDITLAKKIRYSAVISLVMIIEWAAKFLEKYSTKKLPKAPKGVNKSIHILQTFYKWADSSLKHNLDELEKVIQIRNCITHGGGILEDCEFGDEISENVKTLDGFEISEIDPIVDTETIWIDKGVIEKIIKETEAWITDFIEECRRKNLIKISDTD